MSFVLRLQQTLRQEVIMITIWTHINYKCTYAVRAVPYRYSEESHCTKDREQLCFEKYGENKNETLKRQG